MMNNVQLQGKICFINYREGEKDASGNEIKKSFISFCLGFNTGRKENPEDQYNKVNLFRCKAFGKQAEFIYKNFPDKTPILIDGTLDIGSDYTDKNGQLQRGSVEIMIKNVHFCGFSNTQTEEQEGTIAATTTTVQQKPSLSVNKAATVPAGKKPSINIKPIMPK